jgi:HK97 family phage major capsid protein
MSILTTLREKRSILETEIEALFSAEDFNPADETFVRAKADAEAIDAKIKAIVEHEDRKNAANAIDAISVRSARATTLEREAAPASIGEAWTRSKAYEDYARAPRGTSGTLSLDSDTLFRAPLTNTSFDAVYPYTKIADAVDRPQIMPLLDLVPRITVSTGSVEWVVYPVASKAAVVAEGTLKPEMTGVPTLETVTLDVIAHRVEYSRQVQEDRSALMSYLNASLRSGVMRKVEDEIAAEINGATFAATTADALIKGIRRGIANVQTAGYQPNAVLLNPGDYADLDIDLLAQTVVNTGTGPQIGRGYWGIRPVPSPLVASGTAYLGDFNTGVVLLAKSDVQVYTTDSHADYFAKNLLVTLAEVRAKAVVHQPNAITKITVA